MTAEELIDKLEFIQKLKCETATLELKSAEQGCPKHLYDTLSSFSNQDEGGIIICRDTWGRYDRQACVLPRKGQIKGILYTNWRQRRTDDRI